MFEKDLDILLEVEDNDAKKTEADEEMMEDLELKVAQNRVKQIKKRNKLNRKYRRTLKENFTDAELMQLLEDNNFEVSYSNLCLLKEGLENGTITLDEEEVEEQPVEGEEVSPEEQATPSKSASITPDGTLQMSAGNAEVVATPDGTMTANLYEAEEVAEAPVEGEEVPQEEMPAKEQPVEDGTAPRVMISMPVDGSMQIDNQGKQVMADAQGNVQVSLAENRYFNLKNTERLLKSYLTEDCGMAIKEYALLTEDTKVDSVREIAATLLNVIENKITSIDTTSADRSRGDIKQLKELPALQDAITQLETLVERDSNSTSEYNDAIATVIKAILYINQYSGVFKEAYRNKKTVMILKYQSLILSVISSVSYLISAIVDFKADNLQLKTLSQDIADFAPLRSLKTFIKSVDSGEFKTITRDVNMLREYYLEIPVDKMGTILEASETVDMVVTGIKNIFNQLNNGDMAGKITELLYKAVGVVVILFSLRDTFYTLFRMKSRVSDMTNNIQNFANVNNGGGLLSKLGQFANKFRTDAEYGSDMSKREIEDENKKLLGQVKQVQAASIITKDTEPEDFVSNKPLEDVTDQFGFDF